MNDKKNNQQPQKGHGSNCGCSLCSKQKHPTNQPGSVGTDKSKKDTCGCCKKNCGCGDCKSC
jgi:hypothetical protein